MTDISVTSSPSVRDRLLAAATEVFASKGYTATRVSDIVRQAGVAQGTFYLYLKSKQAIFEQLIETFFSRLLADPAITMQTRGEGTVPEETRMLTHQQATSFYNHMGAKQDWQAFYEAPATRDLIAHASFETAQSVFEFGCGTGAFAEQVLAHHLPPQAAYLAVDSSSTMVRLARSRLARFGERVVVRLTDGSLQFDEVSGSSDRFVSNYVLDLLSPADMALLIDEAHRLLVADGRLCLVSLTGGSTPLARLVTWTWTRIHALDPRLVGGCRPVELRDCLPNTRWRIDYAQVITRFGVPSEVVVASKQSVEDDDS